MAAYQSAGSGSTGWRRIEHHGLAQLPAALERMADRGVRHFQLADDHIRRLQHRIETVDHCWRQRAVGTGDNHDGVLAVVIDHDQRHAAGIVDHADRLAIDLLGQQRPAQLLAIGIVADTTDHRHLRAQPSRGHRLIRALATGHRGKRLADQRFAATGQPRCPGYQVHVQAAYHHYFCWHMSLLINSVSAEHSFFEQLFGVR